MSYQRPERPDEPRTPAPSRPVDASMGLLKVLTETALEPEYRDPRNHPGRSPRTLAVVVCVLAGLLFGIAALQTTKDAPAAEKERAELIAQAKRAQATNDQLTAQLNQLRIDVNALSRQKSALPSASQQTLDQLQVTSGEVAVKGPGVVVVVDDAESLSAEGTHSQVIDQDLRQLVNGLWTAGAEAIAINGHRVTTRTAIRGAGSAITVDYVSLTRPYRIEVIGDPSAMPAALSRSAGGQWWSYLKQNYAMRYEVTTATELTLPADPTLTLEVAKPPK